MRLLPLALMLALLGLTASACGGSEAVAADGLTISDAWSRQPADGQQVGVVYATVQNNTNRDVQIVAASSPVSADVQLHETVMDDEGVMSMSEVDAGFTVPAGETFVFAPGGPHVMLMGIDASTFPSSVEFNLLYDDDTSSTSIAEVRTIDAGMNGDDGHGADEMSEDGMEMGDG